MATAAITGPTAKQVCLALVVTRDGMPLGYEVFAGNRTDVTTVEEVVAMNTGLWGKVLQIDHRASSHRGRRGQQTVTSDSSCLMHG